MKRKILNILFLSMLLASCKNVNTSISISVSENVSESTFESPSISESESESLSTEESKEIISSSLVESSPSDSSISESESNVESSSEVIEPLINETKNQNYYLGSDSDLYRINIQTENNAFPVDKENYVNGTLNISEQDANKKILNDKDMKFRLRGNSTLTAAKKAFRIKFDKKQSLFGLTKAKNWVLLANYYDKTNIRNYLAYLTARKMTNLGFQPSSIMVDLYINNEYYGMFMLTEQMEVNEGRVDIENNKNKNGIDSLFLEQDVRQKDDYPDGKGYAYYEKNNYCFAFKYPDADDYLENKELLKSEDKTVVEQATAFIAQYQTDFTWFQAFMEDACYAINNLKNYEKYIDVDSFIDYYLVEEFFKNVDVASTSQYYVIDQANGKLAMGPVWDFDIAMGLVGNNKTHSYGSYLNTELYVKSADPFYRKLFKDKTFKDKVKARYKELRDVVFADVLNEFNTIKEILTKAQERNTERWPIPGGRETWIEVYAYGDSYYNTTTLEGHYQIVEDFINERLNLFDQEYL